MASTRRLTTASAPAYTDIQSIKAD